MGCVDQIGLSRRLLRDKPDMSFKVVIPARYASSRLPGKPLLEIAGKPMIQHVYERAKQSGATDVIVATDDERIQSAAESFGARVCMTATHHQSGTERLAEVVRMLKEPDDRIVVNVQGDEPLLPCVLVRQVAENLAVHAHADIATLCERIQSASELFSPSVVKVVLDEAGYALYFSRAPIPWHRDGFAEKLDSLPTDCRFYRHVGLYAYRAGYLRSYIGQPSCELERTERLEQLRVLYAGGRIHCATANETPGPGVDTVADLERVKKMLS